METGNIERFFLNTLLRIILGGVVLILLSDFILYPADRNSLVIDCIVLTAGAMSYMLRQRHQTVSVLILTGIVLAAMVYQCLLVPMSTTNSLSIILLVGFIHSVMLKGRLLWALQIITLLIVNGIFLIQFLNPEMAYASDRNEMATITITYSIIFFILTYGAARLKISYDRMNSNLRDNVTDLNHKASKIEAQHEELVHMHDQLNALNANLEQLVRDRTAKVQQQNETLLRYAYTNAHHLRGPIARLLGLAGVYHIDPACDANFIISKMVEQAHEIDQVVRQINVDLEEGHQ